MLNVAIVGLGHWGPNYLRLFSQMDGARAVACADQSAERLKLFKGRYPGTHFYSSTRELFEKEKPDAVVIATPTATHHKLAMEALGRGVHLLMEKPLALEAEECAELVALAAKKKKILMTGHTFLYNGAVLWLKDFIARGEAGQIYYLHAVRTNLGPIRQDVNSLIDLATHDISVFLYLLDQKPVAVSAQGASFIHKEHEDVSFLTLYFDQGTIGHVHVSWLDPRKVRQTTVIGDKKMLLFDDINVFEPIRIYDKGVRAPKEISDFSQFKAILYEGDVTIPRVSLGEPLQNECRAFLEAARTGKAPLSDGRFGEQVVKVLSAAMRSLKSDGRKVAL